jgi:ABC-type Mn2+/Zn2+ transport system permease subunit
MCILIVTILCSIILFYLMLQWNDIEMMTTVFHNAMANANGINVQYSIVAWLLLNIG